MTRTILIAATLATVVLAAGRGPLADRTDGGSGSAAAGDVAAKDTHRRFMAAARVVFADMGDSVTASRSTRNKTVPAGRAVAS